MVATRVLPSPVFISAILPWCKTMPPINWTSKGRMPRIRGSLPRHRESFGKQIIEFFPVFQSLLEFGGLAS